MVRDELARASKLDPQLLRPDACDLVKALIFPELSVEAKQSFVIARLRRQLEEALIK